MRGHLRKRGSSWELRAYAGVDPITKRPTYATQTFRGGKREAEDALARLVSEVAGGGRASQDTTVGDLLRNWLDLSGAELSPSTARGYEWIATNYILPTLRDVPLARLKTAQLDRFYAKLREQGGRDGKPLSAATVRQVHAILRRALQQGVRWGWLAVNPAVFASPPKVRHAVTEAPEPDEVVRLIEVGTEEDPDFGCYLHLAATTGARRGELCGLQWQDVDLPAKAVLICRNVVEAAHSVLVTKDTKTHASRRIALDATTVSTVREHQKRCEERAAACGVTLPPGSYVFSRDADGKRPWAPNDVTKDFIRLRNKLGLGDVRLHDLRHFTATRLLAAGVPVRTVSGRLGHANAATTFGVYAHFVEESDREAAAKLELILAPKKAVSRSRRKSVR